MSTKKSYCVKKEKEFRQVFSKKQPCVDHRFVVYALEKPQQAHFRVEISAGKKIGNTVTRSAVKRKIRTGSFQLKDRISPGIDFIVAVRPGLEKSSPEEVKVNLIHMLNLAKILDIREGIKQ